MFAADYTLTSGEAFKKEVGSLGNWIQRPALRVLAELHGGTEDLPLSSEGNVRCYLHHLIAGLYLFCATQTALRCSGTVIKDLWPLPKIVLYFI